MEGLLQKINTLLSHLSWKQSDNFKNKDNFYLDIDDYEVDLPDPEAELLETPLPINELNVIANNKHIGKIFLHNPTLVDILYELNQLHMEPLASTFWADKDKTEKLNDLGAEFLLSEIMEHLSIFTPNFCNWQLTPNCISYDVHYFPLHHEILRPENTDPGWTGEYNGKKFHGVSREDVVMQFSDYVLALKDRPSDISRFKLYQNGAPSDSPIRSHY